ncbi:MAG TPA: hypothetical protein VLX85_01255 [Stellaceae bacterium]|nr:hypothetical protein [Stellaceae bacterium]
MIDEVHRAGNRVHDEADLLFERGGEIARVRLDLSKGRLALGPDDDRDQGPNAQRHGCGE